MKSHVIGVWACLALTLSGYAGELVLREDFEADWTSLTPSGWEMNGGSTPAGYYTRDTNNPHGGQACLRIRHPADAGWRGIDVSPARIPTKKAMLYTLSFWARAEQPGPARFEWKALQSFKPYIDTPSKGTFKLDVGREWKEFKYTLREGLDLFADEGRFLALSFGAVWNPKDERTLWLDDLLITELPDPHPTGMVCERTLPYDTLQHRLQPGDKLEFTVDATNRLRRATQEAGGLSFGRAFSKWAAIAGNPYDSDNGSYTLAPLETAIRELRLPLTRFYAVGDEPFGPEKGIDMVADTLRRVGLPQERCVLEFEHQHADTTLPPEAWARGVKHALQSGYKFHHWEIVNEPYSSDWGNGKAFPSPDAFIEHFKAVGSAIRAVDPQAQLGLDIYGNNNNVLWGNYLLKQLAGSYDFVAPHYYYWANLKTKPFEEVVLTANYQMLDRILRKQALIRAYNPGRDVYQYDTEWGVLGHQAGEEEGFAVRTANIMGSLHVAVRLIYYAREDILRGASGWCLVSWIKKLSNGILTPGAPDKRCMLYWLYYYFNRHLGEWALATEGAAPFYRPQAAADRAQFSGPLTPVLATLSKDESELYLVIANGSWSNAAPCRVHLKNFGVGRATGVVLTNDKLDGSPLLDRKEDAVMAFPVAREGDDVTCTIPAHAVAFVTLERSKQDRL